MTSSQDMIRGRSNVVTLTNNSGGALVVGDVCVQDTTADEKVTTTTSAASVLKVFIAAESIGIGASGKFYSGGYCPLVTPSASVTRGRYLFTHTVAKQAAESATYGAGAFGVILTAGTTPSVWLFGSTAQGSGGTFSGTTGSTDNAVLRADGTGGATIQASLATIDDSGSINIPTGQTYKINNVAHTHASSAPSHAYFSQLCAMLEPMAIEVPQYAGFSYAIASNVTKYLFLAWACQITAGRLEIRTPLGPPYMLPLRGVTLTGTEAGTPHSAAALIDPTLPTYTDAWTTYYDRLNTIATSQTHSIAVTAASSHYPLLPGPYGNIVLRVTSFNFAWIALEDSYFNSAGWPLHMERGDTGSTDYFRYGEPLMIPIRKGMVSGVMSGQSGGTGTALGSVIHMICPASWGKVTDPITYSFRDDFMGAALDTATIWTRAQSSAGNVEIDTTYQWSKIIGDNASWGPNGAHTQASFARATQPYMVIDFWMKPSPGSAFGFMVGFSDGGGQSITNFAHGLLIQTNGTFKAYENNTDRGAVGSGFTPGTIYRVRIRALSGGGATYEIQGGSQYGAVGGATWTTITPGTSSSATATLYAAYAAAGNDTNYVSDVRVYV